MIRNFTLAGFVVVATLFSGVMAADAQGYRCDRYGRSTDPDCYRGPRGVYVCGPCRHGGGEWRSRGYGYGCDRRGRSRDPNCYRGPHREYVCGPCYG